jgi:hypothetical protein
MRCRRALFIIFSLACAGMSVACNLDNLGEPPPIADIYLPTGLRLSAETSDSAARYLYLINSNFDLRYNRGSLQAYDLDALDRAVSACSAPGPDCVIDPSGVLVDEVLVPSLATSFAFNADHTRFYLAARTDPSLTFVDLDESTDVTEDVLRCDEVDRRCSDSRRRGFDPNASPRHDVLPGEPVDMLSIPVSDVPAAGADPDTSGNFVLIAHRPGQASLFYDAGADGPQLIDVQSNLPLEPTGVTYDPLTHLAYFTVYAREATTVDFKLLARSGVALDEDPRSAFLYDAASVAIDGVGIQRDTRALTMNPAQSGQALVASHDPPALLFVDVGPDANGQLPATNVPTRSIVDVATGPNRIALGMLGTRSIAAVSCFDGHDVYLIDTTTTDVVAIIHNLDGPFELAIDAGRQRLYLADFRASVVRVIDLSYLADQANAPRTDAPTLATLGVAKMLMELQ